VTRTGSGRSASRLRLLGSGEFKDPRGSYGYLRSNLALRVNQYRRGRARSAEGPSDGELLVQEHGGGEPHLPV
jgi:hypothetical protein